MGTPLGTGGAFLSVALESRFVHVTVEVVGDDTYTFDVTDETYADLLAALDLSPQAVGVFVDGRPVPEDQPVETKSVRVVRLVRGG
jgi:sulfur carrier protein